MSDYISREAAIEMLHYNADESCASVVSDFEAIPAADVEPVRRVRFESGEQQYVEEFGWFRWFRCSTCYSGFNITGHPRYCPYCGGKAVFESGPPIPVEHVEVTEEEAEAFFQALETPPKPVYPVRRGRWEGYTHSRYCGIDKHGDPIYRDGTVYYCSNPKCRRKTVVKENFCPSCGAKMYLEDDTNDD